MTKPGTLILLPNTIGDHQSYKETAPAHLEQAFNRIQGLIAESTTGAQRFLSLFLDPRQRRDFPIAIFRGPKDIDSIDFILEPITHGGCWGVISDSGLPAIADPASYLVSRARKKQIHIEALYGPCAVTQALMLSGLSGQSFAFHGYLPRKPEERCQIIKQLEVHSAQMKQTQIIMESPYRAEACFKSLIENLHDDTQLVLCIDIDLPTQSFVSATVSNWKKRNIPDLKNRLPIFLFYSETAKQTFIPNKKKPSNKRSRFR